MSLLKAQVNPHFLFNALNSLYNAALKLGATQLTTHIEMLTDILRDQLQYASRKAIPLGEEVHFIRQFVDFQKQRLQSDVLVSVEFESSIDNEKYLIHPMILIMFVENAFKHGISREKSSKVEIALVQVSHQLSLMVRNTNFPKQGKMSSGIGIRQTKKLLDTHYPNHQYLIEANEQYYQVNLGYFGRTMPRISVKWCHIQKSYKDSISIDF